MPTQIVLESRPHGFRIVGDWDDDLRRRYPYGTKVRAVLSRGKSLDMLAFYWALVEHVATAIGMSKTPLSKELLIRCGFVATMKFKNGEVHAEAASIAEMDNDQLIEVVDNVTDLICREYLSDVPRGKLLGEIEQMVGISYPKQGKTKT